MSERPDQPLAPEVQRALDAWTIDPRHPTKFDRTLRQTQAFWLLCLCVAGKGAMQQALRLLELLHDCRSLPLPWFRDTQLGSPLHKRLMKARLGNYERLESAIWRSSKLPDLRTATEAQLLAIHGVGIKTARMFQLHSRPKQRLAVLDTHVLAWMRANGCPEAPRTSVPKHKPEVYDALQARWLEIASARYPALSAAQADIAIWRDAAVRL